MRLLSRAANLGQNNSINHRLGLQLFPDFRVYWIGINTNSTILIVHMSIHPEMSFSASDEFLLEIRISQQLTLASFSNHSLLLIVIYFEVAVVQCVGLLDEKPGFESQARHQNKIRKVFLRRFPLSRFVAKTLRVNNKPAMKKVLKKFVVRSRLYTANRVYN